MQVIKVLAAFLSATPSELKTLNFHYEAATQTVTSVNQQDMRFIAYAEIPGLGTGFYSVKTFLDVVKALGKKPLHIQGATEQTTGVILKSTGLEFDIPTYLTQSDVIFRRYDYLETSIRKSIATFNRKSFFNYLSIGENSIMSVNTSTAHLSGDLSTKVSRVFQIFGYKECKQFHNALKLAKAETFVFDCESNAVLLTQQDYQLVFPKAGTPISFDAILAILPKDWSKQPIARLALLETLVSKEVLGELVYTVPSLSVKVNTNYLIKILKECDGAEIEFSLTTDGTTLVVNDCSDLYLLKTIV